MKTYFYVLSCVPDFKGETGYGGFDSEEAARAHAANFLIAGNGYTGTSVYSVDGETRKLALEFFAKPEYRVIWHRPAS